MLSVIICSREPERLEAVSESIRQTVGVPYEIVAIDNSDGRHGICEAYNIAAAQSQYPLLCFVHEDVLFHSDGWGKAVARSLAGPTVGLIGVVGGTYKTAAPSDYSVAGFHTNRTNHYQRSQDGSVGLRHDNPGGGPSSEVVAVDGMWMCCRREVWEARPFDAETFPGFHLYDLDFSFGVRERGLTVLVVYDVLVEHLSEGHYGAAWAEAQMVFHDTWAHALPASTEAQTTVELTASQQREAEFRNAQLFARLLLHNGFPRSVAAPYVLTCLRTRPFRSQNAWIVRQTVLGPRWDARLKRAARRLLRRPSSAS